MLTVAKITHVINSGFKNKDGTISILAHAGEDGFEFVLSKEDASSLAEGIANVLKGGYNEPDLGRRSPAPKPG